MTKTETITGRVEALRQWMRTNGIYAYIFPSTDPHAGEYVPDHWKSREWISGFNGSAGTAVVTLDRAGLWTDSRYWLAAEEQTAGTPFTVIRCRRNVATAEELVAWIMAPLADASLHEQEPLVIALDAWTNTAEAVGAFELAVIDKNIVLRTDVEPTAELWTDRPVLPPSPVELHPLAYAGETAQSKIDRIRQALDERGANATVITQLDDIAWTLNLRGSDVHCTPVFVAYLLLLPDEVTLFVDRDKVTPDVAQYLDSIGVHTAPYADIALALGRSRDLRGLRFLIDPAVTNRAIYDLVSMVETLDVRPNFPDDFYANTVSIARYNASPVASPIVEAECPVAQMKTLKNDAEIAGLRSAMLKDGVAMVKFLRWLEEEVKTLAPQSRQGQGLPASEGAAQPSPSLSPDAEPLTEMSVDRKLTALRAEQDGFRDISFDTIAGYGAHAAVVHYEATPETDIPLEPHGLLLLDSGAQYVGGTTDITRTIPLGPLTDDERLDYTLVLKGHIRLATAIFPVGTSGTQLDVLARYAMWQDHKNYGHGTGHGVGSYLSVHEGPHQFRMNWMPAPLRDGMTITIEPGIYIAGSHGCRTENTMLIVADGEGWLRLEPLTLCPIDTRPILREQMADDEIVYLNKYHARVREALLPLLDDDADRQWLINATEPF